MLKISEALLGIVKAGEPNIEENYNRYYIGLLRNNVAANYCYFKPKKAFVHMFFRIGKPDDEQMKRLEDADIEAEYTKWNVLKMKFSQNPTSLQIELIKQFVELAKKNYG